MPGGIGALGRVLRARDLRRLQLAFLAFSFSEHATWLAILVYALDKGGPRQVGVVAALQLVPGIVLAPFAAFAGDRFPPQKALALGYGAQCIAMTATALAMAHGSAPIVYTTATVAATCITFTRPVMRSTLPMVTRLPSELVAANSMTSVIEQVGTFAGPFIAGVIITIWAPWTVFALAALLTGVAAIAALLSTADILSGGRSPIDAGDVLRQALGGFAALRLSGLLRALVWIGACAGLVKGLSDVASVTFADERLGASGWQAGVLGGVSGIGALLASVSVTALARTGRVARQLLGCAIAGGAAMLVIAGAHTWAAAVVAFLVLGASDILLELISSMTIQRTAPTAVLSRVFGIVEGLLMGSMAVGALTMSLLISARSLRVAFIVMAGTVTLAVLLGVARLSHHRDEVVPADEAIVDRLADDETLSGLPSSTLERLARTVVRETFPADHAVIREGEQGDRYYLVLDGTADVSIRGGFVRTIGRDGSFGSIALLRNVPRTATVISTSVLDVLAVERDDFLEAVTGHPRSWRVATGTLARFEW
jgi:predicted MFS family arabinose efflux permease